ncbi:MAG: hypothetical protein NTV52_23690 [Acidobacteria bacterium]|nr:hypothetical protein [Acidobacteriota bacterium]
MSNEFYAANRDAIINKIVADKEAEMAAEAAKRQAAAQAMANRRNAMKSTGPRTPEGKAASSQNRLAHGLCSSSLLIRGESQAEFDALHTDIVDAYRPATSEERMLTDQLAEAQWRLNRARRVEAKTLNLLAEDTFNYLNEENDGDEAVTSDPDQLIAVSFASVPNDVIYRNMQRYVTTIERSHQRCLKNLQHAQEKRRTLPPPPPVQPEPEEVKVAAANHPLPEVGFEPQFAPTVPFSTPAYTDRC